MKLLLVLKETDNRESPSDGEFRCTHFQMFGLPLHWMSNAVGKRLGNQIGVCVDVEKDENGSYISKILCVWVLVDITKSLRGGARVKLGSVSSLI